jgi:hypothetical protein
MCLAQLDQLVEAEHLDMWMCVFELLDIFLLWLLFGAVDDGLDFLGLLERFDERGHERRVGKHKSGVRL